MNSTEGGEQPPEKTFFQRAIDMIRKIPYGEVTTYGQIALLISGQLRGARAVGYALAALTDEESEVVPWWRVVNVQGRISTSHAHQNASKQKQLLLAEGITFNEDDKIDLSRYGWDGPEGYF